jgi:hypothetical protein
MADKIAVDDGQLQKLLASIDALADHAPYWRHFLITAVPIFLASLLGLATALLLDRLKNQARESKGRPRTFRKGARAAEWDEYRYCLQYRGSYPYGHAANIAALRTKPRCM